MKLFFIFLVCFFWTFSQAQELNCQVTLITDAKLEVTTVDKEVLEQLKQVVNDFMNNTQWTKDKFKAEERINCNIQLQISKIPSQGVYEGALQIQSSRTAFNSSYNTTVFNFQDENISFAYSRNSIISYAPNQYRDNLTSVLAFYAYFIIGMDYDSFGLKGGTTYFNEAQQIVSLAQSSGASGWKSNEAGKRNRYWLVDNVLHQLFEPLRECNYEYHRKGLDKLYENKDAARKAMFDGLNKLTKVITTRPNSTNVLNFVQAKLIELKNLYADAEVKDKNEIVNLLKKIDPANASKYMEILN
jgi:hypothetical protein